VQPHHDRSRTRRASASGAQTLSIRQSSSSTASSPRAIAGVRTWGRPHRTRWRRPHRSRGSPEPGRASGARRRGFGVADAAPRAHASRTAPRKVPAGA
jgi:hypothetical protein